MGVSGKSSTTSGEKSSAAKAFRKMVNKVSRKVSQRVPAGNLRSRSSRRKRKNAEVRVAQAGSAAKKRKGTPKRRRVKQA